MLSSGGGDGGADGDACAADGTRSALWSLVGKVLKLKRVLIEA